MQKDSIKNEELGTLVLLKCYYMLEVFVPEIIDIKPQIFVNKKLYSRLKNDYFSIEVLQTYKKMKELIELKKHSGSIGKDPKTLLGGNSGYIIKKVIKESYSHYFNSEDIRQFLFKFLIPQYELLDYACKVILLKYLIKEYDMLSTEEAENHYVSFILRGDNFKYLNYICQRIKLLMPLRSATNMRNVLLKSLNSQGKNGSEKLFAIKTDLQFIHYESVISKKKMLP